MKKSDQKNGIVLRIALESRDQYKRINFKKVSPRSSTAKHEMYFLAVTVIAIHSSLPYLLRLSVSNDNQIIKRRNVRKFFLEYTRRKATTMLRLRKGRAVTTSLIPIVVHVHDLFDLPQTTHKTTIKRILLKTSPTKSD